MAVLTLADGSQTLVDDDVLRDMISEPLSSHTAGYVKHGSNGYLHRTIMKAPHGLHVDHINGNKRDNRRENLRLYTPTQNQWNNGRRSHNTSGYKGVYFCKFTNRWRAEIRFHNKCIKIGRFDTAELAARAYDTAALQYHGIYARLNFSEVSTDS